MRGGVGWCRTEFYYADTNCLAAGFSLIAAVACFISTQTISREQELNRRRKAAKEAGETPNLGGASLMDADTENDLIATLRHQGKWNRWGASFAAAAALYQAIILMPLT